MSSIKGVLNWAGERQKCKNRLVKMWPGNCFNILFHLILYWTKNVGGLATPDLFAQWATDFLFLCFFGRHRISRWHKEEKKAWEGGALKVGNPVPLSYSQFSDGYPLLIRGSEEGLWLMSSDDKLKHRLWAPAPSVGPRTEGPILRVP